MEDKMNERLLLLDKAFKKLERGEMDPMSLKEAVKLARKIYEQWVIVQHEFKMGEDDEQILDSFSTIKAPSQSKNSFKVKPEAEVEAEAEAEVYPEPEEEIEETKVSENQTTLIDIIEEIHSDESINERISKGMTKETLAQKHAKSAIKDIQKYIGINQRFSFIKNLFNEDKSAYDDAVAKLNSCASFLEADDFIHNELFEKYGWDENTVHVIKFIDLVERRYIGQ